MNIRILIVCFVLTTACQRATQQPPLPLAKLVEPAPSVPETAELKRLVFPHSVVEGGAYSSAEVKRAKANDPVVAAHYRNINPEALKPLRLTSDSSAYVSYRLGKLVFWTSHKVNLRKGELVLTDGQSWIRGRCGNLIAESPQMPVVTPVRLEPAAARMETPTTLKTMQQYPQETLDSMPVAPIEGLPIERALALADRPNLPLTAAVQNESNWGGQANTSPGVVYSGGSAGGASGGGSPGPTPQPAGGSGYPPNPFLPPNQILTFIPPLPPFQSILIPSTVSTFWPQTVFSSPGTPAATQPPVLITYWPGSQTSPLPTYIANYPQPQYPLTYVSPPGTLPPTGGNPQSITPPSPPTTTTPPDNPSSTQLVPPESKPPQTPPDLATPEPATVIITGISFLTLAGYYLLARIRMR